MAEFIVYSMYSEDMIEEEKIKAQCGLIAEIDTRIRAEQEELAKTRAGNEPGK